MLLRDLLLEPAFSGHSASFHNLPGAGPPSLSHKNWAQAYAPVDQGLRVYSDPELDTINGLFGGEDALEDLLLNQDVNGSNPTSEWLQSEGDSVRTFYTHISHPIQLAFHCNNAAFTIQRSESGPLGPTQVSQTIDFTWGHEQRCLVIGELKRHGIIDIKRWTGEKTANANRIWLGKELRGYCHLYKCYAAVVWDGKHLLILMFQAGNYAGIRSPNCEALCFIFSRGCPTLRYTLFRVATWQIRIMQASPQVPVTLNGYIRRFEWWSGAPVWVDEGGNEYAAHPSNYVRALHHPSGAWYWADAGGNPVLKEDGEWLWDTQRLWS